MCDITHILLFGISYQTLTNKINKIVAEYENYNNMTFQFCADCAQIKLYRFYLNKHIKAYSQVINFVRFEARISVGSERPMKSASMGSPHAACPHAPPWEIRILAGSERPMNLRPASQRGRPRKGWVRVRRSGRRGRAVGGERKLGIAQGEDWRRRLPGGERCFRPALEKNEGRWIWGEVTGA